MENRITDILKNVIHPETDTDIITSGIVKGIAVNQENITVTLRFPKRRDPFTGSVKKRIAAELSSAFPNHDIQVTVTEPEQTEKWDNKKDIKHIIAIASGKGGVGKSTVTANLARTLADRGYRVGILDADIYGPSMPHLFHTGLFTPEAVHEDGTDKIIPFQADKIKVMSIGFFIDPNDALIWRGPMATNAMRQLIGQTDWGELDYLLIDLPPGTGDIHLTVLKEITPDGAIIVTTPQQLSIADVRRGISLFTNDEIAVPILGIVENMSWFTPAAHPEERYYIFGREGAQKLRNETGIDILGYIPLVMNDPADMNEKENTCEIMNTAYKPIVDKITEYMKNGVDKK